MEQNLNLELDQDSEVEVSIGNSSRQYFDEELFNTGRWKHFIVLCLSMFCLLTALTTYIVLIGFSERFPEDSFVTKSLAGAPRGDQYIKELIHTVLMILR